MTWAIILQRRRCVTILFCYKSRYRCRKSDYQQFIKRYSKCCWKDFFSLIIKKHYLFLNQFIFEKESTSFWQTCLWPCDLVFQCAWTKFLKHFFFPFATNKFDCFWTCFWLLHSLGQMVLLNSQLEGSGLEGKRACPSLAPQWSQPPQFPQAALVFLEKAQEMCVKTRCIKPITWLSEQLNPTLASLIKFANFIFFLNQHFAHEKQSVNCKGVVPYLFSRLKCFDSEYVW